MNKRIVIIGTICALLWSFITAMTFGIPESICQVIDRLTFNKVTREVFQLANGFYYEVNNNDMPTVAFIVLFGVIFILSTLLIVWISKRSSEKYSLGWIVFFAILFRLILLPGELIHEIDIYRYNWDANSSIHKINPFKYAPIEVAHYDDVTEDIYNDYYDDDTIKPREFSDTDLKNLKILHEQRKQTPMFYQRIGHWQVPTIYPPVAQALFILPVLIKSHSLVLMKFFFVLFDIAALFLIIVLLKHFNKNPCMSIIYGWSPLVLFEIANRGHYDSIPIFLTLLSLTFFMKRQQWGGVCVLALATLSKFFSGVLFPLLIKPFKIRNLIIFSAVIGLFYAPYVYWNQTGLDGVFKGLMVYNEQWSYNSSIFAVIHIVLTKLGFVVTENLIPAKMVAGCVYLVIWVVLVMRKNKSELDVLYKCFLAIAFLFIVNPVADPWYFCWTIPFLCFFPLRSWYILSGLLILSYLNFHSDLDMIYIRYFDFPLISWIIYVPFYTLLIWESFGKPKIARDEYQVPAE